MPAEIVNASGKLIEVTIRGMLGKADYDRIVPTAKEAIKREGKIKALVVAEGFKGWERGGNWGDVTFAPVARRLSPGEATRIRT